MAVAPCSHHCCQLSVVRRISPAVWEFIFVLSLMLAVFFFYVEHLYLLGSRSKFYKKRTPIWIHSKIVQHSWILHLIASYYGEVWAYIKHVSCLKDKWQTPLFLWWLLNQWLLNTWRVLSPSPFFCDKRYQISFYKYIKYLWSSLLLNVHCNCH